MSNRSIGQSKKRDRGLLSCLECHRRKQKCDRGRPCSDCVGRGVPQKCVYQIKNNTKNNDLTDSGARRISQLKRIMTGEDVILTTESIKSLTERSLAITAPQRRYADPNLLQFPNPRSKNPNETNSGFLRTLSLRPKSPTVASGLSYKPSLSALSTLDPFSILPEIEGAPVPKQLLVRYYLERVAPWVCYLDDDLTPLTPRIAWLPFAIEHRPFFYATLLVSAVHLNRRRPLRDPSALLWFKAETIRATNEKMNDPIQGASDEMIMVALILLVFNVGGGNAREFEIHLRGINEMVKIRGGMENLGMRGMVRNWLELCYGPWHDSWEYGCFS